MNTTEKIVSAIPAIVAYVDIVLFLTWIGVILIKAIF